MKKKILLGIFLLPFAVVAQNVSSVLYDEMCEPLQAVFCDYVGGYSETKLISNAQGRYLGTMIDNALYEYETNANTELFKELMHLLEMAAYLLGYIKIYLIR